MNEKYTENSPKHLSVAKVKKERISKGGPLMTKDMEVLNDFVVSKIQGVTLDVGCGMGYSTKKIAIKSKEVIGIDPDKDSIEWAKKDFNSNNIKYFCGITSELDYKDYFDTIICVEVIEHVKDYRSFLKDLKKMLKMGGKLIITTPNRNKPNRDLPKPKDPYHIREWRSQEFIEILEKYFKINNVYGLDIKNMEIIETQKNNTLSPIIVECIK